MTEPPPPLEGEVAKLQVEGACAEPQFFNGGVIARCAPIYPAILQGVGVEGGCLTLSDITDDGRVENRETRCRVRGYFAGPHAEAWRTFAGALLTASVDRSYERYRLAPEALAPDAQKTNIPGITFFAFEGHPAYMSWLPPPFERAAAPASARAE